MQIEDHTVNFEIKNSPYNTRNTETKPPLSDNSTIGSPLSSAIACVLTKTTGNPVIIEKKQTSEDGRDVTIEYQILGQKEQTGQ